MWRNSPTLASEHGRTIHKCTNQVYTFHISALIKYVLSTMSVSKESISKFLIGNRFHVKLRILSPYSNTITNVILFEFYNSALMCTL